jgi:hypothetical protein
MGAGIQQPQVEQGGGSGAFLDVFKVLFEPAAVFERVRARPNFVAPFLTIIAVQCVLFMINLSYLQVALQAQLAAAQSSGPARPMPGTTLLVVFGLLGLLVFLGIVFLLTALLLWVLASVMGGGEAQFSTLLSVALYSAVPSAILLYIIGTVVLHMQGPSGLTSTQDLQPALGLDLLAPDKKGFVGAVLKAINPFSIWGIVLTAIGVSTTQRVSKGTGFTVAISVFAIGLLIAAGLAAIFNR